MGTISTEGLERNLIAALINDVQCALSLINQNSVSGDIFQDSRYKELFSIIADKANKEAFVDFTILYSIVPEYLRGIVNSLPLGDASSIFIPFYISEIKNIRKKELVTDLVKEGDTEDPVEFTERLQSRFNKLIKQDREFESVQEIAKRVFKNIEKAAENPGQITGVPSGIKLLDDLTWGFQKQMLYLIGARPSMGKSSFALNIAINATSKNFNVYLHSLEDSSQATVRRMFSYYSEIPNERLQKGDISSNEWEKIVLSMDSVRSENLIINDRMGINSMEICRDIMRANSKKKLDLVIIDYIQKVYDTAPRHDLAISKACANFRSLGNSLDVPMIVLSQLSRQVEQRQNKRPMLSDLKETGDLEAQADMVMFLYRDDYYTKPIVPTNDVDVNVAKNKDGRTGFFNLKWTPEYLKFHG